MNNYNVYDTSNTTSTIIITDSTETTRRASWGPPDVRPAVSRSVNPQDSHGDGLFLALPTFLVMFLGGVRS